jgi:hypothetical protein
LALQRATTCSASLTAIRGTTRSQTQKKTRRRPRS